MKTEAGVRQFEAIARASADLVLEFGGALSGEHGDGLVRSPFMEKMFGPVLYNAFREIKQTFDPHNIFNPGKIVDAPPLTANLRYGPAYRTKETATYFDYADYGGLAGAVEMCSGLGVCRKTIDGTMCPSYMATREEAHSTRGRANTLRLVMSGRLTEDGLGDEGVMQVLDLCLECRACKTECPVGVDVARFKSEFLADYWRRHGTPWRARLLGNVHTLARWGSRLAPFANAAAQSRTGRWLNERVLGIDRRRLPPSWSRRTFAQQFVPRASGGSRVVLFNDTFTNYVNPAVGLAGARVLQALGRSVALAPNACCGRPQISQGLLDDARRLAKLNSERLLPLVEGGAPLLFFEPSCLSAVREDAPALLRGAAQEKARQVARRATLFEDFVEHELASGRAALRLKPGPPEVVLHGHCHQKSMGLVASARALLSRIPGTRVVELDSGCCGMAGSFGYAREHFDVSKAIGERRLLPAARGLRDGAVLVASGVSCRHQVRDFTGVRALHAAELLGSLLEEPA
jgi:Fe-S oxidoreductase